MEESEIFHHGILENERSALEMKRPGFCPSQKIFRMTSLQMREIPGEWPFTPFIKGWPEHVCSSEHYLLTLVSVTAGCFHIAKCAHSMSRKLRNRRMHALNGNAAGSRKSKRKRNQKGVSKSDDLAGINVKQLGDCSNFSCSSSTYWVLGLVVGILCSNFFLWACQLCKNRMEL